MSEIEDDTIADELMKRSQALGLSTEVPPSLSDKAIEEIRKAQQPKEAFEDALDPFMGRDALESLIGPIETAPVDKANAPQLYDTIAGIAPTVLKKHGIQKIVDAFGALDETDFALGLTGDALESLRVAERVSATEADLWYAQKLAQGTDPHDEANVQEFATKYKLDPGFVRRNLAHVRYHTAVKDIESVLMETDEEGNPKHPVLLEYMRDPTNFKTSWRDARNLARLETMMVDSFGFTWDAYQHEFYGGAKSTFLGAGNTLFRNIREGLHLSEDWGRLNWDLNKIPDYRVEPSHLRSIGLDMAAFAGQLAITLPAYAVGGPIAGGITLGASVFDQERQQMIDSGISEERAGYAAAASAIGQGALDALQLKWFLGPFRKLANLEGKPFKSFLFGVARIGGGAAVEAPQGMWSDLTQRAAGSETSDEFWEGMPAFLKKSFVRNLHDVLVVAPFAAIMGGGRLMHDVNRARALAPVYKAYDAVMDESAKSDIRKTAPSKFKEAIAEPLATKVGDPLIVINRDEWKAHFQESPNDEAEFAKKLGISDQLSESETSAADVRIPMADWITHAAGTPHAAALRPWVRFGIHEVSQGDIIRQSAQLDTFLGEMDAEIAKAKAESDVGELAGKALELYEQIRTAGYSKAVAEDAVALIRAFGGRMAAKTGTLPAAWWEEHAPQVKAMEFEEYQKLAKEAGQGTAKAAQEQPKQGGVAPESKDAAASQEAAKAVPEAPQKEPQGAYIPAKKLIVVFKGKNQSTVVHEAMHYFLDYMRTAAKTSPEVAELLTALEKYGKGDEEKIAKAFERYVSEGKAPSSKLKRAFQRFRQWLVALYRGMVGMPDLDPEVRNVFDRMLAAEDEIAEAKKRYADAVDAERLRLDLVDKAPIPEERKAEILKMRDAAHQKAVDKHTRRALAAYKSARKNDKTIRKAAEAAVAQDPFFKLVDSLVAVGGINETEAGAVFGWDSVDAIAKKFPDLFKKDGPVSLTEAMLAFEADIEESLKGTLEAAESVESAIARLTGEMSAADEAAYLQEIGVDAELELLDEESLEAARLEYEVIAEVAAAAQKEKAKQEAKEERAAARGEAAAKKKEAKSEADTLDTIAKAGKRIDDMAFGFVRNLSIGAAKTKAKVEINKLKVRDAVDASAFAHAANKASNLAIKAARDGNYTEALAAKHVEVHNLAMAIEAAKMKQEVFKATLGMKNLLKPAVAKTVLNSHQQQVIALLNRCRLTSRKPSDTTPSLETFCAARTADGEWAPDTTGWTWTAFNTGYKNLTLGEFRTLEYMVNWLSGSGQQALAKVKIAGVVTTKEAVARCIDPAQELKDKTIPGKHENLARLKLFRRNSAAEKTQLQTIAIAMDGLQNVGRAGTMGPNEGGWFSALNKAESEEDTLFREFDHKVAAKLYKRLQKLIIGSLARRGGKTFDIGIPVARNKEVYRRLVADGRAKWDFEMLFMAALNLGNDGNQNAFMKGYGFDLADIEAIKSALWSDELDAVVDVGKSYEFFQKPLSEVYQRVTHMPMKLVEPKAWACFTKDGKFREVAGWYHPLIWDGKLSDEAQGQEELEMWKQHESIFQMGPEVYSKMLIERKGGVRPPKLSFDVINRHYQHAAHYITHSEAVREADAITRNPDWKAQCADIMGPEVYAQIRPMLKEIANPSIAPYNTSDSLAKTAKRKAYVWLLAFKWASMAGQITSFTNSLAKVGGRNYIKAAWKMYRNPVRAYNEIKWLWDNFPKFRQRIHSPEKDLRDQFSRLGNWNFGSRTSRLMLTAREGAEIGIVGFGLVDSLGVAPALKWHYEQYLDKHIHEGLDQDTLHSDAVNYAEVMMGAEQPTPTMLNRTSLQQDANSFKQMLTFFITPALKYNNRCRLFWRAAKEGKITWGDFARHVFYERLTQPLLFGLINHVIATGELPDGEDIAWMLGSWWLSPFPVLSLMATPALFSESGRSDVRSPMMIVPEKFVQAAKSVANKEWTSTETLWSVATAAEIALEVPFARIARTALEGMEEIQEGVESPLRLLTAPFVRKDYRHRSKE
jgi:hypothetical protein